MNKKEEGPNKGTEGVSNFDWEIIDSFETNSQASDGMHTAGDQFFVDLAVGNSLGDTPETGNDEALDQRPQIHLPTGQLLTHAIIDKVVDPQVLQIKIKELIAEGSWARLHREYLGPIFESNDQRFVTRLLDDSFILESIKSHFEDTMSDMLKLMYGFAHHLPHNISKEVIEYKQVLGYMQTLYDTNHTIAIGFYADLNAKAMELQSQPKSETVSDAAETASGKRKLKDLESESKISKQNSHKPARKNIRSSFTDPINERRNTSVPTTSVHSSDAIKKEIRNNLLNRMRSPK